MSTILVESLIRVLVERDADAVVIDAGQPPYILTGDGRQAEFSSDPSTSDQVEAILAEALGAGPRDALNRLGAVEQPLPAAGTVFGTLTLVAVRMQGIAWVEIRRERASSSPGSAVAEVAIASETVAVVREAVAPAVFGTPVALRRDEPQWFTEPPRKKRALRRRRRHSSDPRESGSPRASGKRVMFAGYEPKRRSGSSWLRGLLRFLIPGPGHSGHSSRRDEGDDARAFDLVPTPQTSYVAASLPRALRDDGLTLPAASELWPDEPVPQTVRPEPVPVDDLSVDNLFPDDEDAPPAEAVQTPVPVEEPVAAARVDSLSRRELPAYEPQPIAAMVPATQLARLLDLAAARNATTLHMASGSKPAIRVETGILFLDEQPFSADDLDRVLEQSMPPAALKELRENGRAEWLAELPGIGRAIGTAFYDHRGVSAIFRVSLGQTPTADDLSLPPEVQALALEPEGLILVSGPRQSGKADLLNAFVELVNRLRHDYVILLQNEIHEAVEPHGCVISQRKVGIGSGDLLTAARTALQDDPDVLVIDDLPSEAMIRLAMKAASTGHLVIAGMAARTSAAAVDAILDAYTREGRAAAQASLSQHLCGVVTQVMLRKLGGGRMLAREIMLNNPRIASLIAAGHTTELPDAIAAGRDQGMLSLADTIVDLVSRRVITAHEASRRIGNRSAFADMFRRRGVDASLLGPF